MANNGPVMQCDNPDELLRRTANIMKELDAVIETKNAFNTNIKEAGDDKIGVANQKLLDAIVEVGGTALDTTVHSLIVDLQANVMQTGFVLYKAQTGETHDLDRTIYE